MKIKTADLIGPALDWAVAKAWQQSAHYLDRWSREFDEALEEAVTLSINGEHEKADEAAARLRVITNKYVMFFDSIN